MEELIDVGKRIESYMKLKGIGINQLGRLTNTSGSQVLNMINGKKYGLDKIYILLKVLPDLNYSWLLFGEGEMLKGQLKERSEQEKLNQENETLKKEITNLRSIVSYQEVAIEAYRKSFEMVNDANDDIKQVMEFYKTRSENQ
jgi:transcriptional regulator with XRE-family HTH domain